MWDFQTWDLQQKSRTVEDLLSVGRNNKRPPNLSFFWCLDGDFAISLWAFFFTLDHFTACSRESKPPPKTLSHMITRPLSPHLRTCHSSPKPLHHLPVVRMLSWEARQHLLFAFLICQFLPRHHLINNGSSRNSNWRVLIQRQQKCQLSYSSLEVANAKERQRDQIQNSSQSFVSKHSENRKLPGMIQKYGVYYW